MDVSNITVSSITKLFNKRISGQAEAKRKLAAAVAMHYKLLSFNQKYSESEDFVKRHMGSIMLYGPSGSGKTEFFRTLHDGLGVPVEIVDATSLSGAGYKGLTILEVMEEYYEGYGENADAGIIVFDEFDKLCDMMQEENKNCDYSRSLLNEFLKLAEGKEIGGHDTADLLFVFMGSFHRLVENKAKKEDMKNLEKTVGFGACNTTENKDLKRSDSDSLLTNKDFITYGLNPEFMGRVFLISHVDTLSRDDMKRLLAYTTTSPLRLYQDLFHMAGIHLTFSPTAINYIVDEALKMGLGVRGMQKVLTPYMMNLLYELDGKKNVKICVSGVDIKNNRVPTLFREAQ